MEELAYYFGVGLASSAIFFPLAYLGLRKQLPLQFSWARFAVAFTVCTTLLGLLAAVTQNDAESPYIAIARLIIAPLLCAGVIVGARVNPERKVESIRRDTLFIGLAILIATLCITSLFRYEYFPNTAFRTDRWTGQTPQRRRDAYESIADQISHHDVSMLKGPRYENSTKAHAFTKLGITYRNGLPTDLGWRVSVPTGINAAQLSYILNEGAVLGWWVDDQKASGPDPN